MATPFDQIYNELGTAYDPSIKLIQDQINAIPGQTDAIIAQADAKKNDAFNQITEGARARGMGFSGIPLSEQATYASTEYAPAIANAKSAANTQRTTLLQSIAGLNQDRYKQAQSVYDTRVAQDLAERQFQESIRQANMNAAANQSNAAAYLAAIGGGNSTSASTQPQVTAEEQAIFNRAKSLESVYKSDPGQFNKTVTQLLKQGDPTSKDVILNAYRLLGMGNAQALKTWGII